jgi:hypothetical protein
MCSTSDSHGDRKALGRRDYSVDTMTNPQCDPVMLMGEFIISTDRQGVKDYKFGKQNWLFKSYLSSSNVTGMPI